MAMYKHYSFDLWMTLIRSNPLFKSERANYFHDKFNKKHKSLVEVVAVFRQVDLMCNAINECIGGNIDASEMYLMVISLLNDGEVDLSEIDIQALYSTMDNLLFTHLPQVFDASTWATLEHIKKQAEVSANILSNTGFIKGVSLRKVLQLLGLADFFEFQLYSDEVGMSKPATSFFDLMIKEAQSIGKASSLSDIVHIGDNPNADIKGAKRAGIAGILVNSNDIPVSKILLHATENIFTS